MARKVRGRTGQHAEQTLHASDLSDVLDQIRAAEDVDEIAIGDQRIVATLRRRQR